MLANAGESLVTQLIVTPSMSIDERRRYFRRHFIKRLSAGALAAGLPGLSLSLPTMAFAEANEAALARIKRTGVLRSGFIAGAAPYFTKSVATGEWQGFCVDFSRSLAASLGARLQIVETTWGNSVMDLQSNKIDCMFGLGPTEQRQKMVGFSQPLFQNTFTLIARKGFDPKTWEEANHAGMRYSVDMGSNQDAFASRTLGQANVRRYDTSGDATLALQTGQVDAQVLVVLLAATVLSKAPSLGHLVVPSPVSATATSIGIQKESDTGLKDHIDAWLDKTRQSGEIRKIIINNMQKLAGINPAAFPKEVTF